MPIALNDAAHTYEVSQHAYNSFASESSKYNLEVGRLGSFGKSWPHPEDSVCSKKRMSKAGFFHTGKNDCVKCFVCQIKLEGWNPTEDEPWQKHAEAAPKCQFAKLGKEESQMTVEEWMDTFCNQAIHLLESKLSNLR